MRFLFQGRKQDFVGLWYLSINTVDSTNEHKKTDRQKKQKKQASKQIKKTRNEAKTKTSNWLIETNAFF